MRFVLLVLMCALCMCASADVQYGNSAPYDYPISDIDQVGGFDPLHMPASVSAVTYGIHNPKQYEDANGEPYGWMTYFTPELLKLEKDMFWMEGNVTSVIYQVSQKGYNVTTDGKVTLADGTTWQIEMSDITEFISLRKV
jgi:hypothetical protein